MTCKVTQCLQFLMIKFAYMRVQCCISYALFGEACFDKHVCVEVSWRLQSFVKCQFECDVIRSKGQLVKCHGLKLHLTQLSFPHTQKEVNTVVVIPKLSLTQRYLGSYLRHFIFFVSYEWNRRESAVNRAIDGSTYPS